MVGQLLHGHSVNAFRLPDPVVHLKKHTREKESAEQNRNYSLNVGVATINTNSVKFFLVLLLAVQAKFSVVVSPFLDFVSAPMSDRQEYRHMSG